MQRQAVPLVRPQTALVTTGMEVDVARDSGYQVLAREGGLVKSVTADAIEIAPDDGGELRRYRLIKGQAFKCVHMDLAEAVGQEVRDGGSGAADSGRACLQRGGACAGAARPCRLYELGRIQL